jgi:glycosyltransferase involved in cell wall biosynthesis
LPEVVENGHSGLVFQSEDAHALAESLDLAIRNPELREQLTSAGRERAREVFSCRKHIRRIEGIYRELLEA